MIPRNVKLSEAPSHGKLVIFYDVQSTGSQSYMKLAEEILNMEKLNLELRWRIRSAMTSFLFEA